MDIVPYSAEEGVRLGELLAKHGVPSLGPGVGMTMVRIIGELDKMIAKCGPEHEIIKDCLGGLRARFNDICLVSAGQQKETIAHLERAVNQSRDPQ